MRATPEELEARVKSWLVPSTLLLLRRVDLQDGDEDVLAIFSDDEGKTRLIAVADRYVAAAEFSRITLSDVLTRLSEARTRGERKVYWEVMTRE